MFGNRIQRTELNDAQKKYCEAPDNWRMEVQALYLKRYTIYNTKIHILSF